MWFITNYYSALPPQKFLTPTSSVPKLSLPINTVSSSHLHQSCSTITLIGEADILCVSDTREFFTASLHGLEYSGSLCLFHLWKVFGLATIKGYIKRFYHRPPAVPQQKPAAKAKNALIDLEP